MSEKDWELGSGLPDDCDVYVKGAHFGFAQDYQNGTAPLLIWDVESPDAKFDRPVIWSIGNDWEISSDGFVISGGPGKINKNSIYGRMLERLQQLNDPKAKADLIKGGNPKDARTWVGTGFHMKRETLQYKGLEKQETEHLMPVAYLGRKGAPRAVVAQAKAIPAAGEALANGVVPDAVLAKLTKLAKAMNREAFQGAALNLSDVAGNEALMNAVLDDSEQGFYAKARAS